MDSIWFKIFFAAWTGIYLVQIMRGKTSNQELGFIAGAFLIALFALPAQSSTTA